MSNIEFLRGQFLSKCTVRILRGLYGIWVITDPMFSLYKNVQLDISTLQLLKVLTGI